MAAQSHTDGSESEPDHKVVNLYGSQIDAYQNAREAAKRDLDDPSEGEIVEELARAYTGWG